MVRLKSGESRTYVVPLKKDVLKAPLWRRSKKAMRVLREFLLKHTKANKVVFSRWVNEDVWKRSNKQPPSKLKVKVTMGDEEKEVKGESEKLKLSVAHVELVDLPSRASRVKTKDAKKKSLRDKLKEKFAKSEEPEEVASEDDAEKKATEKKAKVSKGQELKMHK